jgi:perosamine synthetase
MYKDTLNFIRSIYGNEGFIPLHEPRFVGNEKKYLNECIDSTFVSSSGLYVDKLEDKIVEYTGAKFAIATTNGTAALHVALILANVKKHDEVITQPLTFVATCNAIKYCGAEPIFIDVDKDTMGLSPLSLKNFLEENTIIKNQVCININTGKTIRACVPMHSFGHPCRIDEIKNICDKFNIFVIEDSAESLGSFYKEKHTGTFGQIGTISFNGNKIITAGGGGCIITNDEELAKSARHLITTAKIRHEWEYTHNMIGYNYRMPNLNAALLYAQMENLDSFLKNKREVANAYKVFLSDKEPCFFEEPLNSNSNYWLNAIILKDIVQRDLFLDEANTNGVMSRPIWTLMNKLIMFQDAYCDKLSNAEWLEERIVNIPSSVTIL